MPAIASFVGRLLLSLLFILSGINKVMSPGPIAEMMAAKGLPGNLAMAVGVFEIVAGLFLALGIMTRLTAAVLAAFTALTILFFHNQFANPTEAVQALKNLAIIGGLLMVVAYGQMVWSYDRMRTRRRGEIATADAEARAHEAELRAARAEGRAEAAGTVVTDIDRDGVPEVRSKRRWF